MHSSTQARRSEGCFCHVAEVVGAQCKTRYALLVSALIRIALSVWPALASISPSTPSHRLPLLRCSDVSKNRPPTICTIQPQRLPSSAASRTFSICTLCFSSLCTGRSRSDCHDDARKSATPWLAVIRVTICVQCRDLYLTW